VVNLVGMMDVEGWMRCGSGYGRVLIYCYLGKASRGLYRRNRFRWQG